MNNLRDAETQDPKLFGRAAKRQRQRANRRLGRAQKLAQMAQTNEDSSSEDLTETTASSSDFASSVDSDAGDHVSSVQDIEVTEVATEVIVANDLLVPRWDRNNLSVEVAEHQEQQTLITNPLPQALFATTPEFEEFRIAYRQFRLGSGFGAKGEVSDSPKYGDCHRGPWEQMSFWKSFRDVDGPLPATAA